MQANNYQIITDEPALIHFIDHILPDTEKDEMFYVCLFARKKYCSEGVKHVKSDKAQLKRFTATKDRLLTKIRQLECPVGSYMQDNNTLPMPQEALALYISPNPRSLWKATLKGISKLASLVEHDNRNANPHAEVMSLIQATAGKKKWVMFDLDVKDPDGTLLAAVDAHLGGDKACRLILETRGGYHIMVEPSKVPKAVEKTWYQDIAQYADQTGDGMIPVPGTHQGGFTPRFI